MSMGKSLYDCIHLLYVFHIIASLVGLTISSSSSLESGSTISFPFYSPLDNDLAMERGAAKNLYNVYMG